MRGLLLVAMAAPLLLFTLDQSHAQRGTSAAAREQSSPANVRFRLRSVEERAATVRRLETEMRRRAPGATAAPLTLASVNWNDTFALSPRSPYSAGQGSLSVYNTMVYSPDLDPSGLVRFGSPSSRLDLFVNNPTRRRLLVECTVRGAGNTDGPFQARLGPGGIVLWQDTSTPYQDVISFLTPAPQPGAGPVDEFRIEHEQTGWYFYGCQVTRLALP